MYRTIVANVGTNPGLAALWDDERQRQRERGEDSQITPPDSPGKIIFLHNELFSQELLVFDSQK